MANLAKIIDDIATSAKLEKFLSSLNHADLPAGWQNDQGIVDAAGKLYREMGTDSPFFKAWGGSPEKVYHYTNEGGIDSFDVTKSSGFGGRGVYTTDKPSAVEDYGNSAYPLFRKQNDIDFSSGDKGVFDFSEKNSLGDPSRMSSMAELKNWSKDIANTAMDSGYSGAELAGNDGARFFVNYTPVGVKSQFNRGTFDPNDPNILRTAAPWLAGGGIAAGSVLGGGEAQASVQPINNMGAWQQMEQQGRVTPDLPVPEAEWSPVDLATAPIGAVGAAGKLTAMALDAPATLAVNRLIDALSAGANTASNWWNGK